MVFWVVGMADMLADAEQSGLEIGRSEPGPDTQTLGSDGFEIAVSAVSGLETGAALAAVLGEICAHNLRKPDFVTLHYSANHPAEVVRNAASAALGQAMLHGGSSCLGVMTHRGAFTANEDGIGAFAIWDEKGAYGTSLVALGDNARLAAQAATRTALERAGRPGEAPPLVWLTSAPGHEEDVLAGIKDVIGQHALIVGGSSADNEVAGLWSQIGADGIQTAGAVISVLFPSVPFGQLFDSGYAPTTIKGRITEASGRIVTSIDNKPAGTVYAAWTDNAVQVPAEGAGFVLAEATLHPLGRQTGWIGEVPYHLLAHPSVIHADGRMETFSNLAAGDEVWLMRGTADSLVRRAGRIAAKACDRLGDDKPAGALVIYCGGCMLAVRERMEEVAANLAQALDGAPFLGVFSFGEQGETLNRSSEHGNLMISCTAFGSGRVRA